MSAFSEAVYSIVARIPCGKVVSYGQIAMMLDKPTGGRAVGMAMRNCPDGIPWQRVVQADGGISGGGWADIRRAMLESEGVIFLPDGRVDMAECRWDGR